jgi:16S rRNA processing protein RimM
MPRKSDSPSPQYLILGEVLRPHGVRGEVRVRLMTAYPERLSAIETLYLGRDPMQATAAAYRMEAIRIHQGVALLKLKGIDDRDQAERLRKLYIMASLDNAVPLEDDEFYFYELIGMTVQTDNGKTLGTISEILETGANEVYIVDSPQFGEVLIPVIDDVVLKIDPDAGLIVVKLPEGLLPGTAEDA